MIDTVSEVSFTVWEVDNPSTLTRVTGTVKGSTEDKWTKEGMNCIVFHNREKVGKTMKSFISDINIYQSKTYNMTCVTPTGLGMPPIPCES